jgi:hypothetical protein
MTFRDGVRALIEVQIKLGFGREPGKDDLTAWVREHYDDLLMVWDKLNEDGFNSVAGQLIKNTEHAWLSGEDVLEAFKFVVRAHAELEEELQQ